MIGDARQRRPRLDHRARRQRARPRRHERRARAATSTRRTSGSSSAPASASGGSRRTRRRSPTSRCPRRATRSRRPASTGKDIDLLIVATVTPDMAFPSTARDPRRPARRDGRGRLRPLGRLHRLHVRARAGVRDARRRARASARSSSAATCSRASSTGTTARRSSSSATARARSCSRRCRSAGFLGFELGADGAGGENLWLPGQRLADLRRSRPVREDERARGLQVRDADPRPVGRGRARAQCGVTIDDVDVYVPHQANVRIIDHATKKLGVPSDRVVINVDRYGNTSSGSIPLALADAQADGRLQPGKLVLMTGMGAGLTWGSALMRWTKEMAA